MVRKTIVAACTLNQWAMDFEGNMNRILQSIQMAKAAGAKYRGGPELEITGYTCEDHFLEADTITHSWEVLLAILTSPISYDIIIDVGMPVIYRNCTYNCRVVFYNKNILLIRPKTLLCDDGNYRESRWFTPWRKLKKTEEFRLPAIIANATGQSSTVIGDGIIATRDTTIGFEICEELWNPQSSHIPLSFDGVEILVNGSGSYMELRKAYVTVELVKSATFKAGGCYLFNNLRGCDGGRVYFNGCSCIAVNGHILARTQQFSLLDVEVATATVDLDDVASYRNSSRSRCYMSAIESQSYPQVRADVSITSEMLASPLSFPINWQYHTPEEEIALGPACWLWDYLRRSGQGGYFLPLSGGIDSASSAVIIYSMCTLIVHYSQFSEEVLNSVRKIVSDPKYCPSDAKELCGRIFFTSYMATENSSNDTKMRAKNLSQQIGSYHIEVNISAIVTAVLNVFSFVTGMKPRFSVVGGSPRECLALQNVQARIRMVMAYLLAQLLLWAKGRPGGLLVVGSANVDEALRGYMTKYDCSSSDINPIGGISKTDLRSFIAYAKERYNLTSLELIQSAPATAELLPLAEGSVVQSDEAEMGLTYEELSCMGRLRKSNRCGPLSTFNRLVNVWKDMSPQEVAEKVKHFYRCYALNRHKMTVLTPSIHAESYSPDDNRYDLRQFLYSISWRWQFSAIDKQVQALGCNNLFGTKPTAKTRVSKSLNRKDGVGDACEVKMEETYPICRKNIDGGRKGFGDRVCETKTEDNYFNRNGCRNNKDIGRNDFGERPCETKMEDNHYLLIKRNSNKDRGRGFLDNACERKIEETFPVCTGKRNREEEMNTQGRCVHEKEVGESLEFPKSKPLGNVPKYEKHEFPRDKGDCAQENQDSQCGDRRKRVNKYTDHSSFFSVQVSASKRNGLE